MPQAKVVAARAHLELQQAGKALGALNAAFGKDRSLDPVIEFWRGLAYFQLFNESAAEKAFRRSLKTSPNGWWTRTASINWLKTVRDSRRFIHARLGISYGSDDNIGQMTYKDSRTSAPNKSYYVADTYKSFDATLSTRALRTGKVGWVPSITAGGQYYTKSDNKGYNPFTVTGDLTATYAQSYRWTYRGSVYYSDLKYDNEAYQKYLGTNLSMLHAITKRTTVHFGLAGSQISGTSPGFTYGPTLGAEGETSEFYWLANASYTGASGEKAKFVTSAGSTSLSSGAIGSAYSTKSIKAGIGRVLFWELDLLGQVTYAKTDYAREDVPSTAAFSTTARADTALSGQVTLSKTLIERRMTFTASYVYTKVDSQGFQGLSYSNGSSPDYNVTRSIASGYLSYGF